ncbi:hypothetical protein TD95_002964 [Thielaviopsis punctulata]|uniref:Carboxypeptidase n=1 Tax=Thielaviopsis punctulata TaxID=72032 RepID=A0A0F4ZLD0_9PEZI|nr:hypothetical protein TD95_002964 [Thielaviopsis punctulata]
MKLSVVLGAASAALASEQVVMNSHTNPNTESTSSMETKPVAGSVWDTLHDSINSIGSEAKALWDEINMLAPEAVEAFKAAKAAQAKATKKVNRKPDSSWDHVVKGEQVQTIMAQTDGKEHRKIGGNLGAYSLRAKAVDPKKLGVDGVKQYSGYLDDNENDKHLFYWFFESRGDPKKDPVVLWLNGGPGCSSLTGLFLELGPASIDKKLKVVNNPFSWNNNASVIFLDQPVNVGFSYSNNNPVSTTAAASKDVYALLSLFFHQFPEYATQDFHIAGESYAGHYIPSMAAEILEHPNRNINLKSLMIGNGLTDGYTQYAYYRPMACGEGGYPAVLSESECQAMDNALPRCQSLINSCYESGSAWSCVPASIYCNNALIGPYQRTGQNVYDIRGPCEDSSNLCYPGLGYISDYLNRDDVKEALGVEVDGYDSCNFDINRNFLFAGDWFKPFHRLVPKILEQIPVLVYAGDADYICNWLGNQAWTNQLEWPGHKAFKNADIVPLTLENEEYGKVKHSGNLTFMQIYGAGHMVPMDQPANSLDFYNRWLGGEWKA